MSRDLSPMVWSVLAAAGWRMGQPGAAGAVGQQGPPGLHGPGGGRRGLTGPAGAAGAGWSAGAAVCRGPTRRSVSYGLNDGVVFGGVDATFRWPRGTGEMRPTRAPAWWGLMAQAGAAGPAGATGVAGPAGHERG